MSIISEALRGVQERAALDAWHAETRRQHAQPGIRWLHACEVAAPYGPDERVFGPPDAMLLQHAAYGALGALSGRIQRELETIR